MNDGNTINENDTIFGKVIRREVPADIVYESDDVLAFRDINPQAPVHILVIPKQNIRDLASTDEKDSPLLGKLISTAVLVAEREGLAESGYRVVINNGSGAGQTVFHLHVHILGGRSFSWPPG